jgi:hypothetical protein
MYIHSLDAVRGRSAEPQKILFPSFTQGRADFFRGRLQDMSTELTEVQLRIFFFFFLPDSFVCGRWALITRYCDSNNKFKPCSFWVLHADFLSARIEESDVDMPTSSWDLHVDKPSQPSHTVLSCLI